MDGWRGTYLEEKNCEILYFSRTTRTWIHCPARVRWEAGIAKAPNRGLQLWQDRRQTGTQDSTRTQDSNKTGTAAQVISAIPSRGFGRRR